MLRLREPAWAARTWAVSDELVVEWRALTVALLDELAPLVRTDSASTPSRCRWPACSRAAPGRRAGRWPSDCVTGCPPLTIVSDGTVF